MEKIKKINLELRKDVVSRLNDDELLYLKGGNITITITDKPTYGCQPATYQNCWRTRIDCQMTGDECKTLTVINCNNTASEICPPMNTQHMGCATTIKTIDGCITKDCQPIGQN